jgi:hypothetical protein
MESVGDLRWILADLAETSLCEVMMRMIGVDAWSELWRLDGMILPTADDR